MSFQIHPDGYVLFDVGELSYLDTIENFHTDGSIVLPDLEEGAGIVVDQFKSALFLDGGQTACSDEWDSCGNDVITAIESYIAAKAKRLDV